MTALKGPVSYYDPISVIRLIRSIRQFRPDIMHTSLWSANIIGRVVGKLMGIPVVSDLHGSCQFEGRLRNLGDQATAPLATTNVAVSQSVAQAYIKLLDVPAHAPYAPLVIPNGIDTVACQAQVHTTPLTRIAAGIPANAFVIGSVGRLEPIKGYDLLLEAFALLASRPDRPLWLYLVGDGSSRSLLGRKAEQLGIAQRVIFAGFQANPYPFYALFDCFALSSHSEGLSMALLEAMCLGLPCVTTHQNYYHDVITHEINGLIVNSRVPAAYKEALDKFYNDREYRKELGMAATATVEKRHTRTGVVTAYAALYEKMVPLR